MDERHFKFIRSVIVRLTDAIGLAFSFFNHNGVLPVSYGWGGIVT